MPQKAFRDPVHNHIYLDKGRDRLILELLSCPEVQRLRRIRQLGVSSLTYPGAEHSRFGHALGACHLMNQALRTLRENQDLPVDENTRLVALAAALLHDIGHGPFSHALEGELFRTKNHERWTSEIIQNRASSVNGKLREHDPSFPDTVAELIEARPREHAWISYLIHSQLDVDRMDYLLRDSHFCGVRYGHHDADRIFHTMRIQCVLGGDVQQPVWLEKAKTAIEEYIFARYYMYWNVYFHPTTRGYEELLKAVFRRAAAVASGGAPKAGDCVAPLGRVLQGDDVGMEDFLSLDDSVIVAQLLRWRGGGTTDVTLRDLSRRFLDRDGLKPIELKAFTFDHVELFKEAEAEVRRAGWDPEFYFLKNEPKASTYDYYHPERESDELSPGTSIFIEEERPVGKSRFDELSTVSPRLKAVTGLEEGRRFCYVPAECREAVKSILGRSNADRV